ncbi:hypothetical protein ARMSODRAFT_949751 [Armillaria solidipes]|uniref:Uncharacterized protein n=1 Tax=Armillaria solidipes TaxID=1076256 RepID=A0A2H3CAY6_9AGAR|nr:hypothetical protein ARMSODRAFT_949751 [Armillaria solidipes]
MSGPSLETSALYIALYARAPPTTTTGLYHHSSEKAGTKFHIRNLGEGWIEGHEVTSGIQKDFLLMGFLKIGKIDALAEVRLRSLVSSVPYNTAGVTCRTWVLGALRNCIDAGFIKGNAPHQLESEAKAFGYSQFDDTVANVQPRPIVIATNSS